MSKSTKIVTRGETEYAITVTRALFAGIVNVAGENKETGKVFSDNSSIVKITHKGKVVACAELEVFTEGYKKSAEYAKNFAKMEKKPVAKIGQVFIGQSAVDDIITAINAATAEAETPEIAAHIVQSAKKSDESYADATAYDAHVAAVNSAMTLNGWSN